MTVSIVIPTIWANPVLVADCVAAVIETTDIKPIVVDGGTFAENCNRGAAEADGDIIVFLNDDTVPQPGWLDQLVKPMVGQYDIGITGCRLVYPDGRLQHAGVYFDAPNGVLTAHNLQVETESRRVEAVTGACMAVNRLVWRILGGFDEQFVNGYEDIDLCLRARHVRRARRAGFDVWYTADATVVHHESQSGPARWSHVRENIALLQERWGWLRDHLPEV